MRILFDNSIFFHQKVGGISRNIININDFLKEKKIDSEIFSGIHINNYLKERNTGLFISSIPLYTTKALKLVNQYILSLFIKFYNPNILHRTFYTKNTIYKNKIKNVITVYDLIHEIYYNKFNKKKIFDNTDLILCPSYKTKEDLIYYYNLPEDKIKVSFIPINKFGVATLQEKIIKENYILYVGDRTRYKNFNNLILAFSIKKKILKNIKFVFFGGGNLDINEIKFIKKNNLNFKNIIQISGNDLVLKNLYQNSNLLIFPSKYEGFGLPPLEAMSLGCPVACSNHPAVLEGTGDAAKIFDPNCPEDIADSIEKILINTDYKKKLILKGYERAKLFDSKIHYNKLIKIYKEIL
jgi:glycosyltransferase involved in cell wall biosynthesis